MKRISAILLIFPVLLLSFSFVVPASAAETSGYYFNVLDYTGINGTTSNFMMFTGSASMNFDLRNTYGFFTAYSVEFTYSYSGSSPSISSFTLDGTAPGSIRSDYIGNGIFRSRAKFNGTPGSSFDITFSSSGKCSINVLSFNVYLCSTEYVPLDGSVYAGGGTYYFSGGSYPYTSLSIPGAMMEISVDSWRSYDSLIFYLYLKSNSISSISAYIRDNTNMDIIPLDVSLGSVLLQTDDLVKNLAFTVDLTSVDRVSANDSSIVVEILYNSTSNGAFRIDSAQGIVFSNPPDPVTKWYQILFFNLQQWFTNLDNTVHNGFEDIKAKLDDVFGVSEYEQMESDIDKTISDFNSAKKAQDNLGEVFDTTYFDLAVASLPRFEELVIFGDLMSRLWSLNYLTIYIPILSLFIFFSSLLFGRRG